VNLYGELGSREEVRPPALTNPFRVFGFAVVGSFPAGG